MTDRDINAIVDHLRGLGIDKFRIVGSRIEIGSLHWIARTCSCGELDCDGWALEPATASQAAPVD